MKKSIIMAWLVASTCTLGARADDKPTVLPEPTKVTAPVEKQVQTEGACATCTTYCSNGKLRRVWEWATYFPAPSCACRGTGCDKYPAPPAYAFFMECQPSCRTQCQYKRPACETTGWRAPALWFTTWTDPGKLVRPAP